MTVRQLIEAVDTLRPNGYDSRQKTDWVLEAMERIRREVWLRPDWEARQEGAAEEGQLLPLPGAYAGLWLSWLRAQLDFADGDYSAYTASREEFNRLCGDYQRWFRRVYAPERQGYEPPQHLGTVRRTCSGCGELALCTLPPGALLTAVTCAVTAPFGEGARLWLLLPGGVSLPREGLDVSQAGVKVWGCALLGASEGSLLRFVLEGGDEEGQAAFFGRILYPGKEKE